MALVPEGRMTDWTGERVEVCWKGGKKGGGGLPPPPPLPPPPQARDPAIQAEAAKAKMAARKRRGRAATILRGEEERLGSTGTGGETLGP